MQRLLVGSEENDKRISPTDYGGSMATQQRDPETQQKVSDALQGWLEGDTDKTLGSLVDVFGEKSFAVLFVLLLGVPALPLPTGGATHVFEIIAALLALQLIIGRDQIWLPQRWQGLELGGGRQPRVIAGLMKLIRRLERLSRPRLT